MHRDALLTESIGTSDHGMAVTFPAEGSSDVMSKEHAAAFKKVMEKKRIIWYAENPPDLHFPDCCNATPHTSIFCSDLCQGVALRRADLSAHQV
jgi:hypothetical protein